MDLVCLMFSWERHNNDKDNGYYSLILFDGMLQSSIAVAVVTTSRLQNYTVDLLAHHTTASIEGLSESVMCSKAKILHFSIFAKHNRFHDGLKLKLLTHLLTV